MYVCVSCIATYTVDLVKKYTMNVQNTYAFVIQIPDAECNFVNFVRLC